MLNPLETYNTHWRHLKDGERCLRRAETLADRYGWPYPADLRERVLADYSPSTANRYLSVARAFMDVGPPVREPAPRNRVLSRAEEAALVEAWRPDLLRLLLTTGIRIGELYRLEEHDWGDGWLTIREDKAGQTRRVPLLMARPNPWPSLSSLRRELSSATSAIQLVDVTFHTFRHTCGTRLAQGGVPLPVIQRWLGHKDIQTTMRYVHISDEDLAKGAACL